MQSEEVFASHGVLESKMIRYSSFKFAPTQFVDSYIFENPDDKILIFSVMLLFLVFFRILGDFLLLLLVLASNSLKFRRYTLVSAEQKKNLKFKHSSNFVCRLITCFDDESKKGSFLCFF